MEMLRCRAFCQVALRTTPLLVYLMSLPVANYSAIYSVQSTMTLRTTLIATAQEPDLFAVPRSESSVVSARGWKMSKGHRIKWITNMRTGEHGNILCVDDYVFNRNKLFEEDDNDVQKWVCLIRYPKNCPATAFTRGDELLVPIRNGHNHSPGGRNSSTPIKEEVAEAPVNIGVVATFSDCTGPRPTKVARVGGSGLGDVVRLAHGIDVLRQVPASTATRLPLSASDVLARPAPASFKSDIALVLNSKDSKILKLSKKLQEKDEEIGAYKLLLKMQLNQK